MPPSLHRHFLTAAPSARSLGIATLLAQVAVGVNLTPKEVAVYAMAIGVMSIAWAWQDLGVEDLNSHAAREADRPAAAVRLLLIASGAISATVLLGLAAIATHEEQWLQSRGFARLPTVLSVMALRPLLAPLASLGQMNLRARGLSNKVHFAKASSAMASQLLVCVIAALEGGVMALVVPYAIRPLLETLVLTAAGAFEPSSERSASRIREAARVLAVPAIVTMVGSVRSGAPLLAIGLAIPAEGLGVLFFAWQIATVPRLLLTGTFRLSAIAEFSKTSHSRTLERDTFERLLAVATLFVPAITLAFACTFPSLEHAIFDSAWTRAIPAVVAFSVAVTFSGIAEITTQWPRAKHRLADELASFVIVSLCTAASIVWLKAKPTGSETTDSVVTVAAVGASAGITLASLRKILISAAARLDLGDALRMLVLGPALAGLSAIASRSVGHSFIDSLQLSASRLVGLAEFAITIVIYLTLMVLAIRFTAESTLRELLTILPPALQKWIQRLFLIW